MPTRKQPISFWPQPIKPTRQANAKEPFLHTRLQSVRTSKRNFLCILTAWNFQHIKVKNEKLTRKEIIDNRLKQAETVTKAFDDFIAKHSYLTSRQLQFLDLLKNFVLEKGDVSKRNLIESPFTMLHPEGIRGIFNQK